MVYQLDRFARNRFDSAVNKQKLKKNGVKVTSVRENISDDASGVLMEAVLEGMAEYYSAELSQKIRRGMDINAEKCLSTGGNIALGFRVDENKKFVIDEEKAPIVKMIFEMYNSGNTVAEITEHLNKKGYLTSRNVKFNKNSLTKMLQNKRYIGIYTYKGIEIPEGMPRIIDDELFYSVAEKMNINKKAPARTKAKEEYILTTKLFCGKCKQMMRGYGGRSKTGKKHYYYACNGKIGKICDKKIVAKAYIEDLVVSECRKLLTDENIDKIVKEIVALSEKEINNSVLKQLNKQLKEIERKLKNMMCAVSECDIENVRKMLYAEIPTLQNEKAEIEKQIALEESSRISLSEKEIKFFLISLRKGNADDICYRKTLISVFVNSIYLHDDKITFIFNSGDKPITITDEFLSLVEENNSEYESSFLSNVAPP